MFDDGVLFEFQVNFEGTTSYGGRVLATKKKATKKKAAAEASEILCAQSLSRAFHVE